VSSKAVFYLREFAVLIRLQNVGTSLTAIIGALSAVGQNLYLLDFLMLFLMAAITNVGGQIHNDIVDFEIDKNSSDLKERPLVKGSFSKSSAKAMVLVCLAINVAIALFYFGGILAFGVLVASMIFGTLYNLYSKKIMGSDIFLSVSFALFALYGAMVVIPGFTSFSDVGLLTWIIVGMSFVHVQIMNSFQGGLKDVKNDAKMKAKTLAVQLGVRVSKDDELSIPLSFSLFNLVFVALTVVFATIPFFVEQVSLSIVQKALIVVLLAWMLSTGFRLLKMKKFDKSKIKHLIRNHELARFSLVPVLLFDVIGFFWLIFLVVEPLVWFVVFNYLLYGERWSKPKVY